MLGLAPKFEDVKQKVKELVQDKILVGHAIFNDLAVSPSALSAMCPRSRSAPMLQVLIRRIRVCPTLCAR